MSDTKTDRKPVMWWADLGTDGTGWSIRSGYFVGYIAHSLGMYIWNVEKDDKVIRNGIHIYKDLAMIAVEDAILQEIAEQSTRVDGCEEVKG